MPTVDKNMAELLGLITPAPNNAAPPAQAPPVPPPTQQAAAVTPPVPVAATPASNEALRQHQLRAAQAHHRQRALLQSQAAGAPPVPAPSQVNATTNVNSNLNDLMNLIGTPAPVPAVAAVTPNIGNPSAPRAAAIPKAPNLIHRNATIRASHPVNSANLTGVPRGVPTAPSARRAAPNDITAELVGMIDRAAAPGMNNTTAQRQAAPVGNTRSPHAAYATNQAAQIAAAQRQAAANRAKIAMNGAAAAPVRRPSHQVTQEQVVVGHFCRHAIKTLGRVMAGKPDKTAKEEELKGEIKSLWGEWVRGNISKTALRQRVSEFVRLSTPEAQAIDVTGEFKQWYQHQLRLQALNTGPPAEQARARTTADAAVALANRNAAMQAQVSAAKNPALLAANSGTARAVAGTAVAQNVGGPTTAAANAAASAAALAPQRQLFQPTDATVGMKRPLPPSAAAPTPNAQGVPARQGNALNVHVAAAANLNSSTPGQPAAKKHRGLGSKKKGAKGSQTPTPSSQAVAKQGSSAKSQATGASGSGVAAQPGSMKPGEVPKKPVRKVDDELDIVRNIVDIEGEEDMLVGSDAAGGAAVDTADYDAAGLILTGPALKTKLGAICARLGLDENVPSETMEIVALAARQRLAHMLEELGSIAKARTGADLGNWKTKPCGIDQRARMQDMRDQELRALDAASNVRREKAASAAAKLAAENTAEADKAAKEAAASADAKKKELALKEKHEMAQRTQRNALSGVLAGIGKKSRSKGQGSSSRKPSAGKGGSGGPGENTKDAGSPSPGGGAPAKQPTASKGSDAKGGSKAASGSKMAAEGTEAAAGSGGSLGTTGNPRPPITLRDCIHFMEGEPRMRKSSILYVWYAKLGVEKPPAQGQRKSKP